jgi:S-adenosylmethionine:tRNA ribosyltransferase-isomerase
LSAQIWHVGVFARVESQSHLFFDEEVPGQFRLIVIREPDAGLPHNILLALLTSEFDYDLPPERIAQVPIEPRHAARLLDCRDLSDRTFADLPALLRPGDLVVVNRTKVRAARLHGTKRDTGGQVEALLVHRVSDDLWQAAVKPSRRLRPGIQIDFGPTTAMIEDGPEQGIVTLRIDAEAAMASAGEVPLPPYIHTALPDPDRYQTMFATEPGSAAASTAALHFTSEVTRRLYEHDIAVTEVVLHIGLDTFRPISTDNIDGHQIHTEEFEVPEEAARAIKECRQRQGKVIAIGTTVVRTLETVATGDGLVSADRGHTALYITPGYQFTAVDGLVTNFHLPRTTLLVLLASFMGPNWRYAYQSALERGYRFASFGDAMYTERRV